MKIRMGFVSNSSSSNFIVAFPKKPKSVEEVKELLFGKNKIYPSPHSRNSYDTMRVALTVWSNIKDQLSPNNKLVMLQSIREGWFEGIPDIFSDEFKNPGVKGPTKLEETDYEAYQKKSDDISMKLLEDFISKNKKAAIYVFSFSDNDGDYWSDLEHGGLFNNLPHLCISCH